MKLFALGDLHLSFTGPVDLQDWSRNRQHKPMAAVNPAWHDHARRIYENWVRTVAPEDVVLVPGDISWAMNLEQARYDLDFLGHLPGTMLCIRGNHDYWWHSLKKMRQAAPPNVRFVQNDAVRLDGVAICGSRGWYCPGSPDFSAEDEKIYQRELQRMENSLRQAGEGPKVVEMHFMPTNERHERSGFIDLFEQYGVQTVVYGHLHDDSHRIRLPDQAWGMTFVLASADFVDFTPRLLREIGSGLA